MYKQKTIGVCIPAHNEEKFIGAVIKEIPDFVDHILIVDDNSRDKTGDAANAVRDQRVEVLRNEKNLGVGGATLRGFARALELGCDVLVKMDGDGQMPVECLPALIDAVIDGGYDMAKGNRFLSGKNLERMPRHRIFGNMVSTFFTKMATGYWHIFDPQNGFLALRAESMRKIDTAKIHHGFFFENDMLFHMKLIDARVKDVAIPTIYGEEQSDIKVSHVLMTFPGLLFNRWIKRIYIKYILTDFSPIALFLISGVILFFGGLIFGSVMWIKGVLTQKITTTGTVMLSVLPLIVGFQLLLQSVVMDIHENERFK